MSFINIQWFFVGAVAFLHPFYISLTDIVYKPEFGRLEIAQKVFWDDLEVALSHIHGTKINFLNPHNQKELEDRIEQYLMENNEISVNGNPVYIRYLGYEIEEDAAWFYMEAEKVPNPKTVSIKNTLLFKDFPTQQNIVNFYLNKSPKSLITTSKRPDGEIRF